jgi:N-acetylglucosamine-6-phosphate deacetylase
VITAERLWDGKSLIDHPRVTIEEGRIAAISTRESGEMPVGARVLDFPSSTLAPAFFDVHIHGAMGHDLMEATPEALQAVASFLATRGVGNFLATTVTAPMDATLRSLEGLTKLLDLPPAESQAHAIGIHLEGPFLSHVKRGVHPPANLLEPDIATFDRFFDAAGGHIRLMTLAPELPGAAELAAHATARGVRISMGDPDRDGRWSGQRHAHL